MANEQNLIPNYERTPTERKEIARKGGIASGKARKEKATMRKILEDMLEVIPKKDNEDKLTYKQLATLGLIKGAMLGNNANYKTILETIGEITGEDNKTSTPTININVVDNSNLEKTLYEANRHNEDDDRQ